MGWTKDIPTKPGLYAAISLKENTGGYAKVKLVHVSEDLQPPPSKEPKEGFDWERHDAPIEEWVRVLVAWSAGDDGPCDLRWYHWWLELTIEPVPPEVAELQKRFEQHGIMPS